MIFSLRTATYTLGFLFLFLFSQHGMSASVQAVKGKRVIINIENDDVKKGDVFYVTRKGKRIGILKVQTIKGKKALANLGKGNAAKGDTLTLRPAPVKAAAAPSTTESEAESSDSGSEKNKYWGIVAGVIQTNADVDLASSGQVSLDGMGFSVKALFDYPLFSKFWFRGLTGIEQFKASGATNLQCNGECDIDIMYITADFWGRLFLGSSQKFWLGAGFDILFPMSKSATALDDGSITNTTIMAFGGGYDMKLASGSYIPLQFEYGMFPESDQVKAQNMTFRIGYAKKW